MTNFSNPNINPDEDKLNKKLYLISLATIVVTLVLVITKVSACFSGENFNASLGVFCTITVSTIPVILVDIIYTMVYAHSYKKIAFHPIYFIFVVLLVLMPLYIAADFMSECVGEEDKDRAIQHLVNGILALLTCFISLIIYTRLVGWYREKSGMKNVQFVLVSLFHLSGIVYCLLVISWTKLATTPEFEPLIPFACVVFGICIIYFILAFSSEFKLRIRNSSEKSNLM